ncbi:MAG: sensor histidine kinase [Brevundimonas sp.]
MYTVSSALFLAMGFVLFMQGCRLSTRLTTANLRGDAQVAGELDPNGRRAEPTLDTGSRADGASSSRPVDVDRVQSGASALGIAHVKASRAAWIKSLLAIVLIAVAGAICRLRLNREMTRLRGGFELRLAERERAMRALQDTLLQEIQGLVLRFQSIANRLTNAETRAAMDEVLDRADVLLEDGRANMRRLRLPNDASDFSDCLAETAAAILPQEGPFFHLSVIGNPVTLAVATADEVLGIAAEALYNVVQHAGAQRVDAKLIYKPRSLTLVIRDDGKGMDRPVAKKRLTLSPTGIGGMRRRAARLGARLTVQNGLGSGVEVILSVPMSNSGSLTWPSGLRPYWRRGPLS